MHIWFVNTKKSLAVKGQKHCNFIVFMALVLVHVTSAAAVDQLITSECFITPVYSRLIGCKYNHHHHEVKMWSHGQNCSIAQPSPPYGFRPYFQCGPLHKLYRYVAFPGDNFQSCIRNKSISLSWKHFYSVQIL